MISAGLKLAVAAVAGMVVTGVWAQAQNYPTKPITFIYPYAPGSGTDNAWRAVSEEAAKLMGTTIVYENRPGAAGKIGAQAAFRAAPDGYTLGMVNSVIGVTLAIQDAEFQIRPGKDYAPIANVLETFTIFAGRPNGPFKDVKGLQAYAKANPGKVSLGTSGPSPLIEMLQRDLGIKLNIVQYNSDAPGVTALLGDHINMTVTAGGAKPHVDSGALIIIGASGTRRWSLYPNAPTFAEQGFPDVNDSVWMGAVATPNLPRPLVARLNKAFNDALATPRVKETFAKFGLDPRGGTPEEWSAEIMRDIERKAPILRATNPNK